jgi:hypothetical protein
MNYQKLILQFNQSLIQLQQMIESRLRVRLLTVDARQLMLNCQQ